MTPILKSVIATAVLAGMSVLTMASNQPCSNQTLKGDYGSTLTGTVNSLPFTALNLVTADGDGNISGGGTIVYNGAVIPSTFTATYVINSDCSGSFASSSGTTENIVISRDGSLVQIVVTGLALGPATVSGTARNLAK